MYQTIILPVDPGHIDQPGKALNTAADLAKHHDARVYYFIVRWGIPGSGRSEADPPCHTLVR